MMKQINIVMPSDGCHQRFLAGLAGTNGHTHNNYHFLYDSPENSFDGLVYWGTVRERKEPIEKVVPQSRLLFVSREPPDILYLPANFLKQFAIVLAPDKRYSWHPGHHFSQFGQNWHIEKTVDEILNYNPTNKSNSISCVVSNKVDTEGHRSRLKLVDFLKSNLSQRFHHFGRGYNRIPSKWDAVAPYKYHLVLENGRWPHYWTEKLVDSLLGLCLPFYCGDPLIMNYFPEGSIIQIDWDKPEEACRTITNAIESNLWESSLSKIIEARDLILNKYHLYPTLTSLLETTKATTPQRTIIKPRSNFNWTTKEKLQFFVTRLLSSKKV
jgi:hypothetical protein